MAKTNILLKRTTNALLNLVANVSPQTPLPSENELARTLGVSRTTIHGALRHLEQQQVIVKTGTQMTVSRRPRKRDHFADTQIIGPHERIERMLMERRLRVGWQPGHEFSETDLARESGASTASVREFLIGFSRFQLVEKRPRSGWRLLGLDVAFVNEVADMRELIEMAAIKRIPLAEDSGWKRELQDLRDKHHSLQNNIDSEYLDFPVLDREFHSLLIMKMKNRFAESYFDIVSFVFHYHYKWGKEDQKLRVACSLEQHIGILDALLTSDPALATKRLAAHLTTSRNSLINSLQIGEPTGPDASKRPRLFGRRQG